MRNCIARFCYPSFCFLFRFTSIFDRTFFSNKFALLTIERNSNLIILNLAYRMCGIVYCLSRKECESLSADLRKAGIQSAPYHAGLSDKKREEVQAGWVADKYNVVSEHGYVAVDYEIEHASTATKPRQHGDIFLLCSLRYCLRSKIRLDC